MPRPVRLLLSATLTLAAAVSADAGDSPAKSTATVPLPPTQPISSRTRALLKAATPRFDPSLAAPPSATGDTAVSNADAENDPSVVRLPNYIVSEDRLPDATEVMTRKALAEVAMNKYLGSKDGLDRGFLNRFTLPQLIGMIPLIGGFLPKIGVTNEDRALQRYYEDERLRKMNSLLDLGTITTNSGNRELGEQIKRETKKTFMRQ